MKQSSPTLVDAPAPASAGPQSGKSPRRPVGKAWLFVAIPGAILLGVALLYLSVWGFAEPSHDRPSAPAVKTDGKAHMTMAEYAAGAGVTYSRARPRVLDRASGCAQGQFAVDARSPPGGFVE